jgi:UDP-glucose 4-epimerase
MILFVLQVKGEPAVKSLGQGQGTTCKEVVGRLARIATGFFMPRAVTHRRRGTGLRISKDDLTNETIERGVRRRCATRWAKRSTNDKRNQMDEV